LTDLGVIGAGRQGQATARIAVRAGRSVVIAGPTSSTPLTTILIHRTAVLVRMFDGHSRVTHSRKQDGALSYLVQKRFRDSLECWHEIQDDSRDGGRQRPPLDGHGITAS